MSTWGHLSVWRCLLTKLGFLDYALFFLSQMNRCTFYVVWLRKNEVQVITGMLTHETLSGRRASSVDDGLGSHSSRNKHNAPVSGNRSAMSRPCRIWEETSRRNHLTPPPVSPASPGPRGTTDSPEETLCPRSCSPKPEKWSYCADFKLAQIMAQGVK